LNYGFAKGYNEALKQVQADYYVLLNTDVEVSTHWLQPMVELLETDKTIAACQPKILSYGNKKLFDYAGAAGGWIDKFGYPFARGRIFDVCRRGSRSI
jgi:GT2 family glycosyltransferase